MDHERSSDTSETNIAIAESCWLAAGSASRDAISALLLGSNINACDPSKGKFLVAGVKSTRESTQIVFPEGKADLSSTLQHSQNLSHHKEDNYFVADEKHEDQDRKEDNSMRYIKNSSLVRMEAPASDSSSSYSSEVELDSDQEDDCYHVENRHGPKQKRTKYGRPMWRPANNHMLRANNLRQRLLLDRKSRQRLQPQQSQKYVVCDESAGIKCEGEANSVVSSSTINRPCKRVSFKEMCRNFGVHLSDKGCILPKDTSKGNEIGNTTTSRPKTKQQRSRQKMDGQQSSKKKSSTSTFRCKTSFETLSSITIERQPLQSKRHGIARQQQSESRPSVPQEQMYASHNRNQPSGLCDAGNSECNSEQLPTNENEGNDEKQLASKVQQRRESQQQFFVSSSPQTGICFQKGESVYKSFRDQNLSELQHPILNHKMMTSVRDSGAVLSSTQPTLGTKTNNGQAAGNICDSLTHSVIVNKDLPVAEYHPSHPNAVNIPYHISGTYNQQNKQSQNYDHHHTLYNPQSFYAQSDHYYSTPYNHGIREKFSSERFLYTRGYPVYDMQPNRFTCDSVYGALHVPSHRRSIENSQRPETYDNYYPSYNCCQQIGDYSTGYDRPRSDNYQEHTAKYMRNHHLAQNHRSSVHRPTGIPQASSPDMRSTYLLNGLDYPTPVPVSFQNAGTHRAATTVSEGFVEGDLCSSFSAYNDVKQQPPYNSSTKDATAWQANSNIVASVDLIRKLLSK